mgnify:CR=1 FL=1
MSIGKYMIGKILLAGLMAMMLACSEEEAIVPSPVGPEEPIEEETILEAVTIQFGPEGTVETRAFNGDNNARKHEFMNSLIAFIVDAEGKIEMVINATDSTSFQKALKEDGAGNVAQYSTTVDLKPGAKTIYAFANMDKVHPIRDDKTSFLTTLIEISKNEKWDNTAVDDVILKDPAATVNFEDGGFIPMSVVRRNVNLTVSGQQVNIELVRLVSRVDITLQNQQGAPVTVEKLTMSDFSNQVALFEPDAENPSAPSGASNSAKEFTFKDLVIDSQADPQEIVSFYVNETWGRTAPFEITVNIERKTMTGNTRSETLPRNHILPLALRLAESALYLEVTAQVAPIGGYPVSVALDGQGKLTDNYAITLPEGCTFSVEGYLVGVAGEDKRIPIDRWTWQHTSSSLCVLTGETEVASGDEIVKQATSNPILGRLTALSGQTVTFDFVITSPVSRPDCHLTINTKAVGDAPWTSWDASLRQWQAAPAWYEVVPLRVANPE